MCSSKACSVCERDRLITQLMEAREALILLRLRKQFSKLDVLILDELGYVPASEIGSALLFDVISSAYECQSLIVTTICACPFECYSSMPLLAGRKGVNSETVINSESQRVRESESQRVLAQIFARRIRSPGEAEPWQTEPTARTSATSQSCQNTKARDWAKKL